MPYDLSGINSQRNAITQALMNVANPPPRTQMPGGGIGAPTQSPIVPSGVAASPLQAAGGAMPPPAQGSPSLPGGVPGLGTTPGMAPGMGVGAPQTPPQVMPPQMGGAPLPPPQNVPGLVGQQPPQVGQLPGTQLPGTPGQFGRF